MTGNDLVGRALKLIGAIAAGETATSDEAADAFSRLNDLLDDWGAERLTVFSVTRNTPYTLTSGTASYTIGTGGSMNIARPVWIENVGLIIDSGASTLTELPIRLFTNDEWAAIRQKSLQSALSQGIWYDYTWSAGLARIFPWPIPNVGTTQLVLYTPTALVQFADQTSTDYTFPPGYARALRYNLAVELAPEWGRPLDPVVAAIAAESKATIKRANIRIQALRCDPALLRSGGGAYNWRTDSPAR